MNLSRLMCKQRWSADFTAEITKTAGIWCAIAGLMLIFATGCNQQADESELSLQPVPAGEGTRVVVLSPALAITMTDLGLDDLIVGKHAYDMTLGDAVAVCGDQMGIDYEALIRVQPTHVLLEWGSREFPGKLMKLAKKGGWEVRSFTLSTLEDIRSSAVELWQLFGPEDGPDEPYLVEQMDRALRDRGQVSQQAGRVLLLMAVDPPAMLGPGSFHHEILLRLGAMPVVTEGQPYAELTAEDLLRLAPDTIVLLRPRHPQAEPMRGTDWDMIEPMLGILAGLSIPAVQSHRVGFIDDPFSLTPSSVVIDLADELAQVLAELGEHAAGDKREGP